MHYMRGSLLNRGSGNIGLRFCSLLYNARQKLSNLGRGHVHLEYDKEAALATLAIDQPEKKNAFSGSMMVQLENHVTSLESWKEGKGLIICSEGDTFCSGGDFTMMQGVLNPEDGFLMSSYMHHILTRLYCLPLVTVCLVHGKALGGGAELTTVTDFRVFSPTGSISFVQGSMGVATGWGGGTRLVKLLGATIALDMLLTGRSVMASEALRIGYGDHIVSDGDRLRELKEWMRDKIRFDKEIVRTMKKIVVGARDLNLLSSLIEERKLFAPLWGGPAHLNALGKTFKPSSKS